MGVFSDLRRMPRWEAIVLVVATGAIGGWWAGKILNGDRSGFIVVTTVPADASVLIDDVAVGDGSSVMIEQIARRHRVSIVRDGYVREERDVEILSGRVAAVNVTLKVSPDTGFELTSEPHGVLVWLDGALMTNADGGQVRTDFRAPGISPGHHVLEVRADGFRNWQIDFEVEPGSIRRLHAILIPAADRQADHRVRRHLE